MRKNLFRIVALAMFFVIGTSMGFAQGFLGKLKKASETVTNITSTENKDSQQEEKNDSLSSEEFLKNVPNYRVIKVTDKDSSGNVINNEDGTVSYRYFLVDKNDNICDVNTAKKHLNKALASGAAIIAKVGVGAGVGALTGKGAKGALVGAGAGLLASAGDIKNVKEQVKLMKECKKVLSEYEKTFTEEGKMIDANTDLTDVNGLDFTQCEVMDKTAEDIKAQLLASKNEGEAMEDVEVSEDLDI